MCGATSAQTQLQTEQSDFYKQAIQQQSTVYGEDQALLSKMEAVYEPILNAGPNQKGFSAAEDNDLNSEAVTQTAESYNAAKKAVGNQIAAEGGTGMPSGESDELKQETAESAANQRSTELSQIEQADYSQGYDEWKTAAAGLSGVAADLSPTSYSGAATGAGSAAATTADQIAEENNSWVNAAIGAAGEVGAAAATFSDGSVPTLDTEGGADPIRVNVPLMNIPMPTGPAPNVF